MRTMVVGDIHGCGLELRQLILDAKLDKAQDQIILVGDLFDRAMHAHVVWEIIQEWGERIFCLQGNHERKMWSFLEGKRLEVPPHYIWAIGDLEAHGCSRKRLEGFLGALPTILVWLDSVIRNPWAGNNGLMGDRDVIIVHAGIDIHFPLNPDINYTVYGDVRTKGKEWWEKYTGENLVLYGHLSEKDCKPRIRYLPRETENVPHCYPNSIGLDTACAHGGYLTGYIIETGDIVSVKAQCDWTTKLKQIMSKGK